MKKDYVEAKKVSERLTNHPTKVRQTSKKFQKILKECNEAVEQILSKSELTEDQVKQGKKIKLL